LVGFVGHALPPDFRANIVGQTLPGKDPVMDSEPA